MTRKPTLRGIVRFALSLARAWQFVWRAAPVLTAVSLMLGMVQSVVPLLVLYLLKLIVDAITAASADTSAAALDSVFVLIALAAAVAVAGVLVNSLYSVVGEAHTQLVADRMHDILHAKSIEVDLEYYENARYYDTLHRAQQEAPYRPARIASGLISLSRNALSLTVMAALLLSFHWAIALVLLVAVVPEALVHLKYANTLYDWRRRRTSAERHAQYYGAMMTAGAHAQELRLFNLGRLFMQQFRDIRDQLRNERLAITARRSAFEFVAQSVAILAVFGAYGSIAYQSVGGSITLGDLVMYFGAFQRGQDFLRQLLRGVSGLYEDNLFLTHLYEFLDLECKVAEPIRPIAVPRPMRQGIAFEGVSFSYGANQVLADIELVIPAGATVALVGENGCGKTTLIKLLTRLYEPTSGRITLDGIDLREFAITSLRREISVIFQDYVRYNLTARENIWFGNINCVPDHERIAKAANYAGVGDRIRTLPNGFDTILGKAFEDGEELSVGEWQKIALARALLREAQIVVLDEPTSAMDAESEYQMFRRFREITANRTAILISHRLGTVKMADRIYVFRDGRVAESGTHAELVRRAGMYAQLFAAQASGYR